VTIEIALKTVDFYQALVMFIKIILLVKLNLFFFLLTKQWVVFLHFGNGINQSDLIDFLRKLFNEN